MTEILWRPDAETTTAMGRYLTWLRDTRGLDFADYEQLWAWSVRDLPAFWSSVAEFGDVHFHDQPDTVLTTTAMPGARWFPGATLNYAEHVLCGPAEQTVLIARSEARPRIELTRGELRAAVGALRTGLLALGVTRGDRVAAYLPNIPEAVIALLAVTSIGAIWTTCSPESGTTSVIDRFSQVSPTVLIAVDGYVYGGRRLPRTAEVAAIRAAVDSIETTISVPYLDGDLPDAVPWHEVTARAGEPEFDPMPFDHPLYIVYSSGTTGKPKAIVHGHGGILLEHLKLFGLHDDLGPADRYFWYTSTNWMAWNFGVSAMLCGSGLVTYDGHPMRPDTGVLWRLVAEEGVTFLGTSPGFLDACRKSGLIPREAADLSAVRTVNSGGAPLTEDGFRWVYAAVSPTAYLTSCSGGTDVASSFVSGCRLLPVKAGRIACRLLGADAHAFDDTGHEVVGVEGELVITSPMPSMPVGFWGDDSGKRLHEAYFDRFPGVWCHGDWVTFASDGTCVISGRSDATLNRGGVRLGTAEFYTVVDAVDEVLDSLVVHLEDPDGGPGRLLLFVTLDAELTDDLRERLCTRLREQLSPRHVPDEVVRVRAIPRTVSGKRMEVPVKRMLRDPTLAATVGAAAADPDSLADFVAHARRTDRQPMR